MCIVNVQPMDLSNWGSVLADEIRLAVFHFNLP